MFSCGRRVRRRRNVSILDHLVNHVIDGFLGVAEVDSEHLLRLCVIKNGLEVPVLDSLCRLFINIAECFNCAVFALFRGHVVTQWLVFLSEDFSDFSNPERPTCEDVALTLSLVSLKAADVGNGSVTNVSDS